MTNSELNVPISAMARTVSSYEVVGPLSFQQEEVLRSMSAQPLGAERYDAVQVFELEGVDEDALEAALLALARRHPALRTRVGTGDFGHCQEVGAADSVAVARTVTEGGAQGVMERLVAARITATDVLASAPLFRAEVAAGTDGTTILGLMIHHLVADGWSFAVIYRDLAHLYAAEVGNRKPSLPTLQETYSDFARRQRRRWAEVADVESRFWSETVADYTGAVWGAVDPIPEQRRIHRAVLPGEIASKVVGAARRARTTPFLTLLTATARAAAAVTSCARVLVGTDVANRSEAERQDVVGMYVNTRLVSIEGGGGIGEGLAGVRDFWLESEDRDEACLDRIRGRLGAVEFLKVDMQRRNWAGLTELGGTAVHEVPLPVPVLHARPLDVMWFAESEGFSVDLIYRPSCIEPSEVAAFGDQIQRVLEELFDE